jgi:hypothetical protein
MATLEQLESALIKADAAGNVEDARALANEIRSMRGATQPQAAPAQQAQEPGKIASIGAGLGSGVGNVALGAQNLIGMGLEKLGADQVGQWLQQDAQTGKAKLQGEVAPYKAANPMTTGGAELAAEIGATFPVGGVLAKGVSMLPGVAKTAPLVQALRTGGFSTGAATAPILTREGVKQVGTRASGGAATSGTAAALIDQEDADMGAMIGGGLPVAGGLIRAGGKAVPHIVGGFTGSGGNALNEALRAGRVGGQTAEMFTKNMRGGADMTEVLDVAKANLSTMNQAKQAAYRADMNALKTDKTVLKFDGIDNALRDASGKVMFKGQVKNEGAAKQLQQVQDEISNWKSLDPAEFHTPEGLDALKQKVGDILETIPFEQKTARSAVGDVYNGIKNEIKKQAPKYADTMKDYQDASELTKEIERALSLGNRTSADTAMRKLQSLMRNNANTNYGNRLDLAGQLEASGGREIMPALAGQALNSWTPRGLQSLATSTPAALATYTIGGLPAVAANAALTSPRLSGEMFYQAGKLGRPNATIDLLRQGVTRGAPVGTVGLTE